MALNGPDSAARTGQSRLQDPLAELVDLLATGFENWELEAFVRKLPDGQRLLGDLPQPPASRRQIADGLVWALHRRGMLDENFFAAFANERRHHSTHINLIRLGYLPGPKPALHLQPGVMLHAGRYRLEELIGSGGFATLWRAHDRETASHVAVKVLSRDVPDREYAWRRTMFIRGATRMSAVHHTNLARVHQSHVNEQGYDFCVLEYVEGRSLHAEVGVRRAMPLAEVAPIVLGIAEGLAHIHESGAVHGDVSPKNIILRACDGVVTPCLVDFDLVVAAEDNLLTMAATGMPATNPYSAPEWRCGDENLDARVDVFALGMTMVYALLGRKLPESLNDPEAMNPAAFIASKLDCPPAIRALLSRACALDRASRPATMASFSAELRDVIREPEGVVVHNESTAEPGEASAEVNGQDRELLRRWYRGDRAAGEDLFDRHSHAVLNYFRRLVYSTEDIQSLTVDTFTTAFRPQIAVPDTLSVRTYLLGIATHLFRRYLARKKREQRALGEVANIEELAEATMEDLGQSDPSNFLEANQANRLLLKAMRKIPVDHQLLLHLAFWEGLSMRQLAGIFGVPMGTISSRLRLAKVRLADILEGLEDHPDLVGTTQATFNAWHDGMLAHARTLIGDHDAEE